MQIQAMVPCPHRTFTKRQTQTNLAETFPLFMEILFHCKALRAFFSYLPDARIVLDVCVPARLAGVDTSLACICI